MLEEESRHLNGGRVKREGKEGWKPWQIVCLLEHRLFGRVADSRGKNRVPPTSGRRRISEMAEERSRHVWSRVNLLSYLGLGGKDGFVEMRWDWGSGGKLENSFLENFYLYWLYSRGKDVMFIFIGVLFVVISFSVLSLNFSRILKDCRGEKKCKINNSNVKWKFYLYTNEA